MSQNLSSAAVVIGALRVKISTLTRASYVLICFLSCELIRLNRLLSCLHVSMSSFIFLSVNHTG